MNSGFYAELLTPEEKLAKGIDEGKIKALEKYLPAGKVICSGAVFCTAGACIHKEAHDKSAEVWKNCDLPCLAHPYARCAPVEITDNGFEEPTL